MPSVIKWRKPYDGLQEEASALATIDCSDDRDYTIQSGRDDADINVLMARFGVAGNIPPGNLAPFYADFSDVPDYQTALHLMREAQSSFDTLSADLRGRFLNDPARLIDFVNNPSNRDEAKKLGLLRPETPPPAPTRVEVVNQPQPAKKKAPAEGADD